jgi:hypothetical protein
MKRILLLFFLFSVIEAAGQVYTNGWIDFTNSQGYSRLQYYKIKIVKEGVYRLHVEDLVNAGIRADTINPARFQLYNRGREQYILTQGVSNNRFVPGGYIEFYGKSNDGWFDEELYPSPAKHTHPGYSLFNDTAVYFLTWNDFYTNKRRADETDNSFSSYTPSASFIKEVFHQYKDAYYAGPYYAQDIPDTEYMEAEGYGSGGFTVGSKVQSTIVTRNIAPGGNAVFNSLVLGASEDSRVYRDHKIRVCLNGNAACIDTSYEGRTAQKISFTVPVSSLTENNTLEFSTNWTISNPPTDVNGVSYYSLKYPHTFNFANEGESSLQMIIDDEGQGKSYLEIVNFIGAGEAPILYDLTNNKRIIPEINGTTIRALVPNSPIFGSGKTCFLTKVVFRITADNIRPVSSDPSRFARFSNFRYTESEADFIILTHKSLMDAAKVYKDYRRSKNNYTVALVDIDEIYDQFGYGIRKHPLSVRKYAEFVLNIWTKKPGYLFLLGKAYPSDLCRQDPLTSSLNLVPTFGHPPSDHLLTARINTFSKLKPGIATGRLSAKNNKQVLDYLQKIQDYEASPPEEWMKQVIHLAGGNDDFELSIFKRHLADYESRIEAAYFGGHVTTFAKNDPMPQVNPSDSLRKLVEEGVSIITFFGHSTPFIMDYSLEEPESYNIKRGHYSFYITDGCYSGDIFSSKESNSEKYVLIPNKGCIGFMGPTYLAIVDALRDYTNKLYDNISKNLYGQPVGKCIQNASAALEDWALTNPILKEVLLEMTLHGDPAVVINSPPKPDIQVSKPSVFFTPSVITTDLQEFTINIVLTNIGKSVTDSFFVHVRRIYPDNSDTTVTIGYGQLHYKDTLRIKFPVNPSSGAGLNSFEIFADANQQIDELWAQNPYGESNNRDTVQLLILSNDLVPVYPPKYAIIPDNSVTLKAVTGSLFSSPGDYVIEIDTTDQFNSSLKLSTSVNASGLVSWTPSLVLKDSTVYFWRTSRAGSTNWKESSFIYIPNKNGWAEDHFFQLKDNLFKNLTYNKTQRRVGFTKEVMDFRVYTIYADSDVDPRDRGFFVNNKLTRKGWSNFPNFNGLSAVVFDPAVGKFWESDRDNYGQANYYAGSDDKAFDFNFDDSNTPANFKNFLDSIPEGHYLAIYSIRSPHTSIYPYSLKKAFEDLGSTYIGNEPGDTLLDNDTTAYLMFSRKGSGIAREKKSTGMYETISLSDSLVTNWTEGTMSTGIIGPARKWGILSWKPFASDDPNESVVLNVTAVTENGNEVPLKSFAPDTLAFDLSQIVNAELFPYMKLNLYFQDPDKRSPVQIDHLRLFYEPAPEATINPGRLFSFLSDTLQEGEILKFSTAIENISDRDMDSLRVKAWVYDRNRVKHILYDQKRKPLQKSGASPGDTIVFSTSFDTKNFPGNNSIWLEVNPEKDQIEQSHLNNIGFRSFFVKKDISNPFVDVTFDGVHILDGDIVSARPHIVIKVNDENKYLPMTDTALFKVWLLPPGATDLSQNRLFFKGNGADGKSLRFVPGTSSRNIAEINFNPELLADGVYTLMVEGRDASKNQSGKNNYRTTFEVINRSTITGVLNYPNPFSTSTRFVFVLTGSELPTAFKIQILTVSGKVVREIMMNELGPIHIGRNITQYAWDGKDEFGDQLANGLYIYRVIATINGSEIEKRETAADKFFVKGYGKMYLMR